MQENRSCLKYRNLLPIVPFSPHLTDWVQGLIRGLRALSKLSGHKYEFRAAGNQNETLLFQSLRFHHQL